MKLLISVTMLTYCCNRNNGMVRGKKKNEKIQPFMSSIYLVS